MRGFGHWLVAVTAVVMGCCRARARRRRWRSGACSSSRRRPRSGTGRSRRACRRSSELGAANNFAVDATEDAAAFTPENLARYEAVVWLSTTGDVLDAAQQAAFEAYIEGGGGYAGVHAASDTEYTWNWYGGLVGAYFGSHPENQTATVEVADHVHPSTKHLPTRWSRFDEWYGFQSNPRGKVHVLATLDETTYAPGGSAMGTDHPIAWCHYYQGGRAWYTGMGHTDEAFATRPSASTCSAASCGPPARSPTTAAARSGTTSRRPCSTTTSRARWASTSRRTVARSTSSAPARCA